MYNTISYTLKKMTKNLNRKTHRFSIYYTLFNLYTKKLIILKITRLLKLHNFVGRRRIKQNNIIIDIKVNKKIYYNKINLSLCLTIKFSTTISLSLLSPQVSLTLIADQL